jgi:hypothetical protein
MILTKSLFGKLVLRVALFQLGLLLCQTGRAAVGFTVTPAAVSNTYNGLITLQVTGLNTGDTVVVQKYLDANADGVIDAGDILWQQFNLTDGQAGMVFGGVTNVNVPGDTDTVPGRITAKLSFQADFAQAIVGNYLIKLSSPSGGFTAVTHTFTVTNYPYAQKLTGTVASNGLATPFAAVLLFQSSAGNGLNPVGGTVANNAGVYTIAAPPGAYLLAAFKSNFLADTAAAANLVLSNGATLNTNLNLIATNESISGRIFDTNNPSLGLPGMLMPAESQTGLLGIGFTDTNGSFLIGVTSNQWKVDVNDAGLALHGYVRLQNKLKVNTTGGSVSGLTIALPKATALFYGTVKDTLGNPLAGPVDLEAYDNNYTNNFNGEYQSDGYTDASGYFVIAAIGGLGTNDPWSMMVNNSSSFPNYDFSQPSFLQNGGTNVPIGAAVQANIFALLATNVISGDVLFDGSPVTNVQVNANSEDSTNFLAQAITDGSGHYAMNVGNATWNVQVSCQGGNNSLDSILGPGNYQCPCSVNVTIDNNNGTTNFTVAPSAGPGGIFGYVTNSAGNPIVGVNVSASDCSGDYYSMLTGSGGYYAFNSIPSGVYDVSLDCNYLNGLGYQCVSDQHVTVSGNVVEQDFTPQSNGSGGPLQITTTALPDGLVGTVYDQPLNASGGQSPYNWSLSPGSLALPAGLGLLPAGAISGTPTNAAIGTNYFSVRVTDNQANIADQPLSIIIYPALTVATNSFPNGTNGIFYSAQVLVSGGDPFYIGSSPDGYSAFLQNGSLPPGLNFSYGAITSSNEYFVISGTPTNNGTFSFTGGATDADGNQVLRNITITIVAASLQITTASLNNATAGVYYANQLQGSGGTTPYLWTIANGSQPLPSALTLSTNGLIAGVPAASGTNSFIVRLTDNNLLTVTRSLSLITIPRPGLAAAVKSGSRFQFLLNGASNQNYTVQVSTNLNSTNWISLFVTNNSQSNSFLVTDPNATNKAGFYRILIGP